MDKRIIVPINLFSYCHQIILIENDKAEVVGYSEIDKFPIDIPAICQKYGTNNVQLIGSKGYLQGISNLINQEGINNYSMNLNIEIMEEI